MPGITGSGSGAGMGLRPGTGPHAVASGVPFSNHNTLTIQIGPTTYLQDIAGAIKGTGNRNVVVATGVLGTAIITAAGTLVKLLARTLSGGSITLAAGALVKQ